MNRTFRFSIRPILLSIYASLATSYSHAALSQQTETNNLTTITIISIGILAILSGIFLGCLRKLINDKNKLKDCNELLRRKNNELLEEQHCRLDKEADLFNRNLALEKRITSRTETVNKVNHELTKALETIYQVNQTLDALMTAINSSQLNILIIDKHYRVCYASKPFLQLTGLELSIIKNQPIKLLEKHICLPEMAPNGLTLNKNGLIDTKLKCTDSIGQTH